MSLSNHVVILSLVLALPSSADIYRCKTEDGNWLFTDRQCTDGEGQKVAISPLLVTGNSVPTGLSEAERQALSELDQRMVQLREFRSRQRKINSIQTKKKNILKQQNCTLAVRELARIRDKKSHGYKLSEALSLDQQVSKMKELKKANC
jgi:hypothetical protein